MAHVRAVLWHHLAAHAPNLVAPAGDPNELLPAADFADALQELAVARGDAGLHEAGASYAELWARTFRTLVRHLRGHPEQALAVWANEVYPYLRGDRLAARTQRTGRRSFEVLVHDDLPQAYIAGLLERFVGLSRAHVHVEPVGGGRFVIETKVPATDRFMHMMDLLTQLRVPLLLTSLLAALVGTTLAWRTTGALPPLLVAAVLWGTISAQSGANAVHDLALPRRVGLAAAGPPKGWLWFQAVGSYAVAASAMVFVAWSGRPGIVVFAALGLGLGLLYRRLRDQGWGPAIAAISHGPLTVWGSYHAFGGAALLATPVPAVLLALPTGLLAAAILYLDDLADRPLDEAAGKRTLVVRLPRRRQLAVYALLLAGSLGALAFPLTYEPMWFAAAVVLAAGATWLIATVRRHLDDPHGLAPARMGTIALFVATVAVLVAATAGGLP